MKKIGHILGFIFALVLLSASKDFLFQYPFVAAGFLFLVSAFYAACSAIARQTIFLYPMMLAGALGYFLCLHGFGIHYVWFPACSLMLIFLLGVAKRIAEVKEGQPYAVAFRNGIDCTVAIFTIVAFVLAFTHWSVLPHIFAMTFLGYALFYYIQSRQIQSRQGLRSKILNYVWVSFSIAGSIAPVSVCSFLPFAGAAIFLILAATFGLMGTRAHRQQGGGYALPIVSGAFVAGTISFIYSRYSWDVTAIAFFVNTITFWYIYQASGRTVATRRIAGVVEKVFTMFFKAAFVVLPIAFWSILLHQGFPFTYVNGALCAAYALFFTRLTRAPYRSFLATRNHYVYLAGAFVVAFFFVAVSAIGSSILLYAVPAAVGLFMIVAGVVKRKGSEAAAHSLIDLTLLPTVIAAFMLLSSDSFTPRIGLTYTGVMAATFLFFLAVLRTHVVLYPLSFVLLFGLHCGFREIQLSAPHVVMAYVVGSIAFAYLAVAFVRRHRGMTNVSLFTLLLFSAASIYSALDSVNLVLIVLCALAAIWVNLGAVLDIRKGAAAALSAFGHGFALWAIAILVLNKLPVQSPYVLLALAAAYFVSFAWKKKMSLAYPACVLASVGYLLLLTKVSPPAWVMLAYFPLTLVFLLGRSRLPLLASAYFSSALVAVWVLAADLAGHVGVAAASALYAASYFFVDATKTIFRTWAACFALLALYAVLNSFVSPEISLVAVSAAASALFLVGTVMGKTGRSTKWYRALVISGLMVLFVATGASTIAGFASATKIIIVLSSFAYLAASVIFRREIFLYLLTVNVALLFFNFIQSAGTTFTRDLFVYFLYGAILIGILFAIPHIKKLRRYEHIFVMFTIANWKGKVIYSLPAVGILFLAFMFYTVKITEHPRFCASCHNMHSYVASWERSPHNQVRCVSCHYEPGFMAVAHGKVDGLLQLAKFVTNRYSPLPVAQVKDSSCLRSECHSRMDRDATVAYGNTVQFEHSTHLDRKVRGQKLRCATCHSQAGGDVHMGINTSACFTCHFKDADVEPSDCRRCHARLTADEGNEGFDHAPFFEGADEVDCATCHPGIIKGDGRVVPDNCLFCHAPSDVHREMTLEEIHDAHVTNNKIECAQCHSDIKHGKSALEKQQVMLKAAPTNKAQK